MVTIKNPKKSEHFYMRITSEQKDYLKECANKRRMTMAAYLWHLVMKDNEEDNNG